MILRRPDICIRKHGVINISSYIVSVLHLREGDVISFSRDKGDDEYYIYVVCRDANRIGNYTGICRRSKRNSRHIRVNSVHLCSMIREVIPDENIDLIVGKLVDHQVLGQALPIILHNRYGRRN